MAQNLIGALRAGSGIDVGTLARDLVEATRAPQKNLIDQKIARAEARISGYSVVQYGLSEIRKAFDALKSAQSLSLMTVTHARSDAVSMTASAGAPVGNFQIEVLSVVASQSSLSNGFALPTTPLGEAGAVLSLGLAGVSSTIEVADLTPEGIVRAINEAGVGVTAELVKTGGALPYRIHVSGPDGAGNEFTLTSDLAPEVLDFSMTVRSAADARVVIDGIEYERKTNRIDDVLSGVVLNLRAVTAGAGTATIARDTTDLTQRIRTLATAYQDFAESLDILMDRDSEVEEFGGALVGERLVRQLRSQVEGFLRAPGVAGAVSSASEFGLTVSGKVSLDETKLKRALELDPDAVVRFFAPALSDDGRAGQSVKALDAMLNPRTGLIAQQQLNAGARVGGYQQQLLRLESQMEALLNRYTRQFGIMESIVGASNSLRTSLEGTFEGLAAMYTRR